MGQKRLAIQLYGHLRTYKQCYKNFFKNIVVANEEDAYKIDIFLHTWDKWSQRSVRKRMNPSLDNKIVSKEDINELINIYKPKKYKIESLNVSNGQTISPLKAIALREEYEKENTIKYDWILTTRYDILFFKPLKIDYFINELEHHSWFKSRNAYTERNFPKTPHKKVFFVDCQNTWIPMIDYRHCTNEADLCYFSNFSCPTPWAMDFQPLEELLLLPIKYKMFDDFCILRDTDTAFLNAKRYEFLVPLDLNEQDLQKDLNLLSLKNRIMHSLTYQLGQALIINSKSFIGLLALPFILWYIAKKYQRTNYAKLPALKDYYYTQHQEASKIKEHLSYKLGQAFIKAYKNKYKFGFVKFIFVDVPRIKKEFKQKQKLKAR